MNIRIADKNDYKDFKNIHFNAFNGFFLTSLGVNFLNVYYKASLKSNGSIAFCAVNQSDKIIGFCSGCENSLGFNRKLILNNIFAFIIQTLRIILTNPKAIIRLVKNLEKNKNINDDSNYAELFSIAVLPSYKGSGIGKSLIKAFEEEARKRGCKRITLTTDYTENQDVLSFYKSSGYEVFYQFTTFPKRKMYKLIKKIDNEIN